MFYIMHVVDEDVADFGGGVFGGLRVEHGGIIRGWATEGAGWSIRRQNRRFWRGELYRV